MNPDSFYLAFLASPIHFMVKIIFCHLEQPFIRVIVIQLGIKTSTDVNKITVSRIKNMELQKPGVVVTMDDGQAFLFPLMTSFQIHRCNEFLRSLNLGMDVYFGSFEQYIFLVESCMNQLRIQRIMDSLELPDGLTPDEVYFTVLGRLSTKHKKNLIAAKVDYLKAYVHEAVQIIKKERMVQA